MQHPSSSTAPSPSPISAIESLRLADGRALCAQQWRGSGRSATVFLHGLLDSSDGWRRLCERLRGTRIAFDLPGFGYSDAPSEGSIEAYARDVLHGLDELGAKRFTLVGHSLGGAVATALAELAPDRATGLVLLSPTGFGRIPLAELVSLPGLGRLTRAAMPFALGSRLAVTLAYSTMVTGGVRPEPELVDRVTTRGPRLVDGVREATQAIVKSGRATDAFHRRRVRYDGPVYAIWGDRDRLVPASHRQALRAALPQARIELWEGMGHHPVRERFDDLIALIAQAAGGGSPRLAPAIADAA
jgi:pimeloyl-ACP methyl ester carboxylesterase